MILLFIACLAVGPEPPAVAALLDTGRAPPAEAPGG